MAVLLYQIGIFLAIIIASNFGQKSRNTAVILIAIFTVLQVFVSWLLLLQFVTIFVAYHVSNSILSKNPNSNNNQLFDRFSEYGLSLDNPILLIDIASSYKYVNQLNTFNKDLSYERKGSSQSSRFENPIDIYEFRKSNKFFCNVYIYPYASENKIEVPKPFQKV